MTGRIASRLKDLKLELPKAPAPVANYVPWVKIGSLLFVSGQITMGPNGVEYAGTVGRDVSVEDGRRAARLAALNVVAQASAALEGDLDRVKRVVKVTGWVSSAAGFTQHPDVVNGASDLFVDIFGDAGRHARAAVGSSSLPRNASVEIEAIFEIA
jgi:enamine deaminase RidA (YjgF/YER057c/UK114 family)